MKATWILIQTKIDTAVYFTFEKYRSHVIKYDPISMKFNDNLEGVWRLKFSHTRRNGRSLFFKNKRII